MTQDELVRRADVSLSTLQRVFKGHVPLPKQQRALERVLHWDRGSLVDVIEGRPPRPIEGQTSARSYPDELEDDVERQLWDLTDLDEEARWNLIDFYRVQKRRRMRDTG